ncbi:hypothetical protein SAMN04488029_2536 [Reichenbachiella faecimaris]|uniref:Adhesin domain-containing protein n=1 Tax=Reichenbachiella faecimaris TaxID=692418 RepID=A0A1W2GFN6_REIFA|nr:hypothetical protein [Reichenbachiella faecimaris]SMD35475.1 hypothetical protein SAMN04488029_2536 [Reichenbachiella faecimaris]
MTEQNPYRVWGKAILILIGVILAAYVTHAQSRTLVKNISQSFKVNPKSAVELTNKYGQVIMETWDRDSVRVEVKITAYGKNDETLSKNMERVDVDFTNFGDVLTIETILDRNSSVFKEVINSLGDYSKTLISKNKISIDYQLTIPQKASLKLDNKYGDVYIESLTQESTISVAHGDFKADELSGTSRLNLSFCKARIKKLDKAFLELKGAELYLRDGGDLVLTSSSSTFEVKTVQSLKVDSRNDKIHLEKATAVRGYSSFSNILIDSMLDRIDMELNYGDLLVHSVNSNFNLVNLKSKTADVNISLDMGSYFSATLTGRDDRMYLTSNFMGMNKTRSSENDKIITLTGVVGMIKPKQSQVTIEGESGEVTVYLEETGGITNKN